MRPGTTLPLFAIATLTPVILLAFAALAGGMWIWAALIYITGFAYSLDALAGISIDPAHPEAEFPAANRLSITLALAHFVLLALAVWALAAGDLSGVQRLGLFMAFGLFFGQVSNSNAHELIHRGRRGLHRLGMWVFISLLFGHHTSAHPLIHHRYAASDDDPNSARLGDSYYRFAARAWVGSFRAGLAAERARLARTGRGQWWRNPYVLYVGAGAGLIALVFVLAGWRGALTYIALAGYAQAQLLLSDYVQHYGLRRARLANGKLEPVGPAHSWNAPQWFTGLVMLNAPRHSDHHAHPATPYPALVILAGAPMLPRSLPAMATLALFPRLWRRVMDSRVARQTGAGPDFLA